MTTMREIMRNSNYIGKRGFKVGDRVEYLESHRDRKTMGPGTICQLQFPDHLEVEWDNGQRTTEWAFDFQKIVGP